MIASLPVRKVWPHRLVVRTVASHAANRGSSPLGVTNFSEFPSLAPHLLLCKNLVFVNATRVTI